MRNEAVEVASRQTRDLMQTLATQTNRPLDEVRRVYEAQFHRLDSEARIKIYVHVLAARHTREILSSH